jgi:hypothetical protein
MSASVSCVLCRVLSAEVASRKRRFCGFRKSRGREVGSEVGYTWAGSRSADTRWHLAADRSGPRTVLRNLYMCADAKLRRYRLAMCSFRCAFEVQPGIHPSIHRSNLALPHAGERGHAWVLAEYSSSATDWESDTLPQSTSHSTLPQADRDDSRLTSQFAMNVSQRKLDSERVSSGGFEIASQCGRRRAAGPSRCGVGETRDGSAGENEGVTS